MDRLTFGTDGWRGIIADVFTFDNLSRAAQAYADFAHQAKFSKIVVGYDTRFMGRQFAQCVAEVLAANGLEVLLASDYLPTPALSFAVKHLNAGGGVMITASHNPPSYSGFKLKGSYGGTATPDIYNAVSKRTNQLSKQDVKAFDAKRHAIHSFEVRDAYYEQLLQLIDHDTLRHFTATMAHEAMGGAGTGWLKGFFDYCNLPIDLYEVHPQPTPLFYSVNPEPIPQNLHVASAYMREENVELLVATDGDADRLGAILPGGGFFSSHQIFAVLLELLSSKGKQGKVVKTFSVSRVIERLAQARGLDVLETPIGFKYIVDEMLGGNVLIGGEESGGIGVAGHIPERDGIANSLLLLEAIVSLDKPLREIFADIERQVDWQHAYDRLDLQLTDNRFKDAVMESLETTPDTFAGRKVLSTETLDGVKLNLSDNAWLMIRASGTEPVLRIYCEAATQEDVAYILENAQNYVGRFA